jgi:hypothetical protein
VAFGQLDGGVLCPRCREGKQQIATVNGGTLRVLAQMAQPGGQIWRRMEIERGNLGEVRGLVNRYLCNLLGRKPRLQEYLRSSSG